jgi:hypothetical protein
MTEIIVQQRIENETSWACGVTVNGTIYGVGVKHVGDRTRGVVTAEGPKTVWEGRAWWGCSPAWLLRAAGVLKGPVRVLKAPPVTF